MVGIFGVGGIGKTTIAKAVYNRISSKFEGSCFLKNIRETSKTEYGLVQLQETLLSNILGAPLVHDIGLIDRGINVIKNRLRSKRVFLILDDVDDWGQLKALAGNRDWFGLGSRIIITTRDQNLLSNHEVDATYEVEELNHYEALKLFSLCAIEREKPLDHKYFELSKRIIRYAGGLPLALEVLGLDLRGRSIHEWESALKDCKRIPHKKIQKILRMSYDDLRESEKNIFLDIACFFKGENVDYVVKILDSCGLNPNIGIKKLMDECLIAIDACNKFEMHDLLQDMGREIVREESPKEPGGRSRLWYHEDIRHVLEENTGTNQIEGMLIDLSKEDLICLSSEAFVKMKNLRYFINRNACFYETPSYLSNELRVLICNRYPSQSLPYNFQGKKMVDLRITCSLLKELGVGLQNFQKLTIMDFSHSEFLTKIPDLSWIPNLEWLDFANCTNLVEVHASVGSLNKLEHLSFARCTKLTSLPTSLKFRYLKCLWVEGCLRLQNFPEIEFEREYLGFLSLANTDIKELPLSIGHLSRLLELDLRSCKNLDDFYSIDLPKLMHHRARNEEDRCTIEQFNQMHPPTFDGRGDPTLAEDWIPDIEELTGEAKRWWISERTIREADGRGVVSWPHSKQLFFDRFFPRSIRDARAKDFADLVQGTMMVHQYAARYVELSRFALYLIPDEEKKT
ncbi:disease resistance protein RUN1-like [Juglans regia]|nr:disease resistance protein RUN1-like [Juglans regia]